jgi:hypothetical protein
MKASEFYNYGSSKSEPNKKQRDPKDVLEIIKMVSLAILFLSFFAGITIVMVQVAKHPSPKVPEKIVQKIVSDLIKKDSVINIPIHYRYQDSHLKSNGDTTYWFFHASVNGPKDYSCLHTKVIKLTSSYFNFYEASEFLKKKDPKCSTVFIDNFIQISQASYISYKDYANNNKP